LTTSGQVSRAGNRPIIASFTKNSTDSAYEALRPGTDREIGRVPSSKILERKVTSNRSIASIFGLPANARVLKLVRVRYGDGIPLSHEVA